MTELALAVLAASLVGSLHCAGMCGPFLAFVVGAGPAGHSGARGASALQLQLAYHLARGAGYALLGAAAGGAGHLVDLAGVLAGLEPLAAAVAGATLLALGLGALLKLAGARLAPRFAARLGLPAPLARLVRAAQVRALRLPPLTRALAIGATTTLLPCGWLYAFAVTAGGTGAPARGALILAVFWLGTLPVLVSLGAAVRGAARALGPRSHALASAALVGLGLWTLAGRAGLAPEALAHAVEADGAAVPDTATPPPCCSGRVERAASSDAIR